MCSHSGTFQQACYEFYRIFLKKRYKCNNWQFVCFAAVGRGFKAKENEGCGNNPEIGDNYHYLQELYKAIGSLVQSFPN